MLSCIQEEWFVTGWYLLNQHRKKIPPGFSWVFAKTWQALPNPYPGIGRRNFIPGKGIIVSYWLPDRGNCDYGQCWWVLSKSELTGRRWLVKFNPLLLMSRLISINLQLADQTERAMPLLRKEGVGGEGASRCHQTFTTQKVCLMGWKILSI